MSNSAPRAKHHKYDEADASALPAWRQSADRMNKGLDWRREMPSPHLKFAVAVAV